MKKSLSNLNFKWLSYCPMCHYLKLTEQTSNGKRDVFVQRQILFDNVLSTELLCNTNLLI